MTLGMTLGLYMLAQQGDIAVSRFGSIKGIEDSGRLGGRIGMNLRGTYSASYLTQMTGLPAIPI